MILYQNLEDLLPSPCVLTWGSFDGIHLGHQHLFEKMRELSPKRSVLTFTNHPGTVLGRPVTTSICSLEEKLELLEKLQIDQVVLIPFTQKLAAMHYIDFLHLLKRHIGFTHLLFGKGSQFGAGREGDQERLLKRGPIDGFSAHYIDKFHLNGELVSSSRIREFIESGNIEAAERLLGRPLFSSV